MRFLKVLAIIVLILVVCVVAVGSYVKFALPDVGDASDLVIEKTPDRIERGKYLANSVAVCMDCHSTRDWSKYSAPMVAGTDGRGGELFNKDMGFPGTFYAPNITPYALGTWSDGEIFRAITTGVNKNGRALFPIMAYHRFGQMDKEDIYSVIAYIRTLNPLENSVPEPEFDFPVNFLVNTMPTEANLQSMPSKSDTVLYGKYMINAAGCVDCHSQVDKGAIILGTEFGGGMEFIQPAGIIRSPNITFHAQNGIGAWTKESFVAKFRMYADTANHFSLKPTELNTPMPWAMYAGMEDGDLEAIYAYLKSLAPLENKVTKFELRP